MAEDRELNVQITARDVASAQIKALGGVIKDLMRSFEGTATMSKRTADIFVASTQRQINSANALREIISDNSGFTAQAESLRSITDASARYDYQINAVTESLKREAVAGMAALEIRRAQAALQRATVPQTLSTQEIINRQTGVTGAVIPQETSGIALAASLRNREQSSALQANMSAAAMERARGAAQGEARTLQQLIEAQTGVARTAELTTTEIDTLTAAFIANTEAFC